MRNVAAKFRGKPISRDKAVREIIVVKKPGGAYPRRAEHRHAERAATRLTFGSIFRIAQSPEKPPARLLCKSVKFAQSSDALVRSCRGETAIQTDRYQAPGGLIRKAPEGKKDPGQKKQGGKGQQNNN